MIFKFLTRNTGFFAMLFFAIGNFTTENFSSWNFRRVKFRHRKFFCRKFRRMAFSPDLNYGAWYIFTASSFTTWNFVSGIFAAWYFYHKIFFAELNFAAGNFSPSEKTFPCIFVQLSSNRSLRSHSDGGINEYRI